MKYSRTLLAVGLLALTLPANADLLLKQSTASQAVKLGPFVDSTDGNSEETGLTIANTDIKCSKNGGTLASKNSGGGTHDANGWYTVTFDATDTNTVGRFQCFVHVAGALPVVFEANIVEEAVYDAQYGASAVGYVANAPVNVAQFGGSNGTFASGRPEVNMTHIAGSSVNASTAQIGVNVVNFGGSAGTFASGRPEVNTTHWTGSSLTTGTGPLPGLGILDRGDLQSDSTTTNQIRSAATFADSELIGATNLLYSATTGAGQRCLVSANVGSTDTLTCSNTLITDPTGTVRYELYGTAPGSGGSGATAAEVWTYGTRTVTAGTNITSTGGTIPITSSRVDASVGAYQSGLTPLQPTTSGRTLDVSAGGEAGVDWANVGSPSTTVSLSGTTVGTATTVGTVNALANNSVTAAAAASDLTTELQAGLATASALATVSTNIGTPTNLGSGATLSANNVDIESQTDDIGAAGAGLTAVGPIIRDVVVEDQGNISLGCGMAALLGVLAGDSATSGGNTTFEEHTGTETRVTSVVVSAGNRTVTITCPTYP